MFCFEYELGAPYRSNAPQLINYTARVSGKKDERMRRSLDGGGRTRRAKWSRCEWIKTAAGLFLAQNSCNGSTLMREMTLDISTFAWCLLSAWTVFVLKRRTLSFASLYLLGSTKPCEKERIYVWAFGRIDCLVCDMHGIFAHNVIIYNHWLCFDAKNIFTQIAPESWIWRNFKQNIILL